MERRRTALWGVLLILVGIWALLGALGFEWAELDRAWPAVIVLVGVVSLVGVVADPERDPGDVWFGVSAILVGVYFGYITIGAGRWDDLAVQWPVFAAIAGFAWIVAWFFDVRQVSNLVMGLVALVVGGVAYGFTTEILGPGQWDLVASWWPLILVLIGLGLIVQYLVQKS